MPAAAAGFSASEVAAAAERARQEALEEAALLLRLNPFALSHHSDSLSAAPPVPAGRLPAEPDRHDFKVEVAEYYGLFVRDRPELLRNMLNETMPFAETTLAHIWPASYTNWGDVCASLGLPGEFYKDPRNYLLLPKPLHDAFDHGHAVLIPDKTGVTIRIIKASRLTAGLESLDGRRLCIPRQGVSPYKRELAYFALRAKGMLRVSRQVGDAIWDSLSASCSEGGSAKVKQVVEKLVRKRRLVWHHR